MGGFGGVDFGGTNLIATTVCRQIEGWPVRSSRSPRQHVGAQPSTDAVNERSSPYGRMGEGLLRGHRQRVPRIGLPTRRWQTSVQSLPLLLIGREVRRPDRLRWMGWRIIDTGRRRPCRRISTYTPQPIGIGLPSISFQGTGSGPIRAHIWLKRKGDMGNDLSTS